MFAVDFVESKRLRRLIIADGFDDDLGVGFLDVAAPLTPNLRHSSPQVRQHRQSAVANRFENLR